MKDTTITVVMMVTFVATAALALTLAGTGHEKTLYLLAAGLVIVGMAMVSVAHRSFGLAAAGWMVMFHGGLMFGATQAGMQVANSPVAVVVVAMAAVAAMIAHLVRVGNAVA